MAIRQVLLSNTFEQQRQLINLIGTDVGDAALLVTPSKVLSTSINQVVAGFVTLSGQVIQLENGSLVAPSLSFDTATNLGLYRVDANTLGVTRNLYVASGLTVDGDITFRAGNGTGGTLTFGDLNTDNIIFNADLNSNIIPNTTNTFDLGSTGQRWRSLYLATTAFINTLDVSGNATVTGTLTVNGGNVTTTASGAITLFNTVTTSISAFGAATSINIGAAAGTVVLRPQTIVGTNTTQNVYNTVATTVNAFGAGQQVNVGASGISTVFTVRNDSLVAQGKLTVTGGEILSGSNTFNILVNNSDVRIGSAGGTGSTIINNSLTVKGTTLDLTNQGVTISVKDNINPALKISEGANDYLSVQTTDTFEKLIFHKNVSFLGNASFGDSDIAYFGDGNDLQIYHSGTDSVISDAGSGQLYLTVNTGSGVYITSGFTSTYLARFINGGAVELYHNNIKELETTAAGITVFGDITASGLTLNGNLTVNGTTTTINSTNLSIDDLNIILADGASTSATVDGAGITLGTTGITFTYSNTGTRWSSTENLNIASTKTYQIDGTTVLSSTQVLGKGFTNAAGEIVTTDGTQTLSNKTLTTPTISSILNTGTLTLPTSTDTLVGRATSDTLTNKTYGNASSTTDADATVDSATTSYYAYVQSASATTRTINISNLIAGRVIKLYLRNTNISAKIISILASTTTTGFAAVNLSKGDAGGTSLTNVSLAATSGTAVVTIFNANGVIGGSIS